MIDRQVSVLHILSLPYICRISLNCNGSSSGEEHIHVKTELQQVITVTTVISSDLTEKK